MKLTKRKVLIYSSIVMVLVVGIIVWNSKSNIIGTKKESTLAAASENKITVKTQPVKTMQKTTSLTYKANLEPSEVGIVSSKLSGKVVEILFENGKAISAGDPLIRIDDQDIKNNIASAQAQLAVAGTQLKTSENQFLSSQTALEKLHMNLDNAQRSYDRTKALFGQGNATKVELQGSESALKAANADLESTKTSIETARLATETAKANVNSVQTNINNLEDTLTNTIIRAPIQGIIDEKSISIGQFISPGMVMAKVKNISTLNAVIQVEQSNLKYIKVGMKAKIKFEDTDSKDYVYVGIVKSIDVSADPASRVFNCKIQVDNKNRLLHPGIFANVELTNNKKHEAIMVPIQALSGSEGSYSVFVAQDGKAHKRSVSVGEISKDTAEILSGLNKDESIIITNLNILQDGDSISVSE